MSDEATVLDAPPPTPPPSADPGVIMATTLKRKPVRRNASAKPKRAHARYRNAAPPPAPRAPRSAKFDDGRQPPPMGQRLTELGESVLGSALTSFVGANAVKVGLPTWLVLPVLGGLGVALGTRATDWLRHAGVGATSAVGSQAVLLAFAPAPAPAPKVASLTPAPAAPHPAQLPARKNADLGTLPPGMLDAAFERARSELAVGDGYVHEHHHQ